MAQTPQGFDYKAISAAYFKTRAHALDDNEIASQAGIKITTITGDPKNKKITSKEDLEFFKGKNK